GVQQALVSGGGRDRRTPGGRDRRTPQDHRANDPFLAARLVAALHDIHPQVFRHGATDRAVTASLLTHTRYATAAWGGNAHDDPPLAHPRPPANAAADPADAGAAPGRRPTRRDAASGVPRGVTPRRRLRPRVVGADGGRAPAR